MNNNRILQLSKYHRTTSITARITTSKQSWIKEHFNHLQQIETKRPQLIFIGDSLVQGFKRYHHTQNIQFDKQAQNCGIKGDKIESVLYRICNSSFPKNIQTIVIIRGTNNLDRDNLSDIVNGLIFSVMLLLLKHKEVKIVLSGILTKKQNRQLPET